MRVLLLSVQDRPRPILKTPRKGEEGDRTIESMAEFQSVDYILKKYGGNLRDLAGWRSRGVYGDAPVNNLEDAFEILRNAHDDFVDHMDEFPFATMDDALRSMRDGTFFGRVRNFNAARNKLEPKPEPKPEPKSEPKSEPINKE